MSQRRILLLDDDSRGRHLRAVILKQSGFAVLVAPTVTDAQAYFADGSGIAAVVAATSIDDEKVVRFCAEVRTKHSTAVVLLGHNVWPTAWERKYYDAYIQKLDGPEIWIRKLRELVQRKEEYRRHGGARILNVDDNDIQRYAVTKLLMAGGYNVSEASTGEETLQMAASHPDLILLDINLPDIDGFEVCRRLRRNPTTAKIAIVHLSATMTKPDARTRGLRNGADEYLFQPIGREALLGAIDSVLNRPAL